MSPTPWYKAGPTNDDWPRAPRPKKAIAIGEPEKDRLNVYLGDKAMQTLANQLAQSPHGEVNGLLIGHPYESDEGRYVVVTECLFSPSTDDNDHPSRSGTVPSPAHLQKTWQTRTRQTVVVGWFHGAPGRPESMTSAEQFAHSRYYSQPWQIGLLIDAKNNASSLWGWHQERLARHQGYYYFQGDPMDVLQPARQAAVADAVGQVVIKETPPTTKRRSLMWLVPVFLLFIYLLLPGAPGGRQWFSRSVANSAEELDSLRVQLQQLESENAQLEAMRAETDSEYTPAVGGASSNLAASDLIEPNRAQVKASASPPPSIPPEPRGSDDGGVFPAGDNLATASASDGPETSRVDSNRGVGGSYVIQPGDTMWRISERLTGDPNAYKGLAELNDIHNPDVIYPGQTIKKPE